MCHGYSNLHVLDYVLQHELFCAGDVAEKWSP